MYKFHSISLVSTKMFLVFIGEAAFAYDVSLFYTCREPRAILS